MKHFVSICLAFIIFCLILTPVHTENSSVVELKESVWTWEPLNVATFKGEVYFDNNAPENILMKLSFVALPGSDESGEVVFYTVNGRKLTLSKQKESYSLKRANADSFSFTGNWRTPEDVYFTKVEIICEVYDADKEALISKGNLIVSRSESDILSVDDGRFKIRYNFPLWTRFAIIASSLIWVLAIVRIIKFNKKRKR